MGKFGVQLTCSARGFWNEKFLRFGRGCLEIVVPKVARIFKFGKSDFGWYRKWVRRWWIQNVLLYIQNIFGRQLVGKVIRSV